MLVVLRDFVFLIVEMLPVGWGERHNGPCSVNCTHLYGFVVDERIDCDRRSLVVRAVCLSSEAGSIKPMSLDLHKMRTITDLQDVVRTVNQVYAAMVTRVIAAKSHPNLYVFQGVRCTVRSRRGSNAPKYHKQARSRALWELCGR